MISVKPCSDHYWCDSCREGSVLTINADDGSVHRDFQLCRRCLDTLRNKIDALRILVLTGKDTKS